MKSERLVADQNNEITKLKIALKYYQGKREGLVKEKIREMKDMKKGFDEEKRCLEDTLEKKEKTISELRKEFKLAQENMEIFKKELEFKETNCDNLKSLLRSNSSERMKSGRLVADQNREIMKLKMALKKKDFNINHPHLVEWERLVNEKIKEMKDMRKAFDEEKICLEDTLEKKENTIGELRKEFKHALDQANLLNSDLQKHQQNLVEHFKIILKAKQSIRNTGTDETVMMVMKMYEEALNTVVKSLVSNDVGLRVLKMNSEAESFHNYLSDRNEDSSALEKEDNNNVV